MSISYPIREWLQRAFTEQPGRINEVYFFDRLANEFYSVFITDYFLTYPNSTEDFPNSPYSKNELAVLTERINRQESNDPSVIVVPRLTIKERKEMMQIFLDEQHFHDPPLQNLVETENGRTNLDFGSLLSAEAGEKWEVSKWEFIQTKIESFCNLQNINLETVTLWTDEKITTIALDVNGKSKGLNEKANQSVVITKPWWKFW
jgi:hypothetical protein